MIVTATRRSLAPDVDLKRAAIACLMCGLVALQSGCQSIAYYAQAIHGQARLLWLREDIAEVSQRSELAADTRRKLQLVLKARQFAEQRLLLPVGGKFRSYVELDSRYPVWNVFAAPALSLDAKQWCYPLVGCAVYRGFFAEASARQLAADLCNDGYDVYVGPVLAYSTLGWFDDPVLSSFMTLPDDELVGLLFHELAHSLVFAPGDSEFNESFATFIEEDGMAQWLADNPGASAIGDYIDRRSMRTAFTEFVLGWRERLVALYASDLPEAGKISEKQRILADFRAAYRASTAPFAGRYDSFFDAGLNNAKVVTVATYHRWLPAFRALRARSTDVSDFHARVRELRGLPAEERVGQLELLQSATNPDT